MNNKNQCYGYVLKGREKKTPRRCQNFYLPGMYAVKTGSTVCLVEGIKDSFLLRKAGLLCLPMLTSSISDKVLKFLEDNSCKVVYIPDNDSYRDNFIAHFKNKIQKYNLIYSIYKLEGIKDLGDFFLPECREIALYHAKRIKKLVKYLEKQNGQVQ